MFGLPKWAEGDADAAFKASPPLPPASWLLAACPQSRKNLGRVGGYEKIKKLELTGFIK